MSSTTTSSSQQQRSLQRERERYQRERQQVNNSNNIGGQLLASGQPVSNTLFPEPIKKAQEDETTRRIKSTLGDFNQVQLYLNYDSKPLLGLTTRDLNRINGNKAKIEQIFSEMKQTFQPLGALEDGESEESHDREDDDNQLRRNGDDKGSEDGISLSPMMNMPSNVSSSKRKRKLSHEDSSDDDGSDDNDGDQDDREGSGNEEANNENDSDSDSSSGSSNSASSSSESSSTSTSSSEEDDEDDKIANDDKSEHGRSDLNSTDCSSGKANITVKKECGSPQQEISTWNLMSFVDKKTLPAPVVTSNSYVNKENVKVTNDSINDVIDRVARGELGEHASSRSHKPESPSPASKKRRKSQPAAESRREHQLKQPNQQKQLKPPPPPPIQQPQDFHESKLPSAEPPQRSRTKLLPNSDRVRKDTNNLPNNNNTEKDASPKAPDKLVVSISLLLLKRIPGQNNRVKHDFDSEHLTQPVTSEPLSPQHCSSLPHQPAPFRNKRQPSPPPASQQPQACSQENVSASSTSSNSASVSAPPSHLLPFTPPLPSSLSNRTTPDNLVADDYLSAAKKLKHDADRETDRTVQARKYLQAVLYFILTGNAMEQRSCNDLEKVCVMYKETLNLIRFISGKFAKSRTSSPEDIPTTDHKLTALSCRCQSLLCLKLSRLKEAEIRHNFRLIQSSITDHNLLSKSKEPRITIPTHLFSAMHRQITMLQQLNNAHDLWQQADHLVEKHPSCAAFFSTVDNECGPLSLNSSFDDLVRYVTTGLKILE